MLHSMEGPPTGGPSSFPTFAPMMNKRILLVCMGNICRSPMAEGLVRYKARLRGLAVETDSAGTIDHHAGESPDARAQRCMRAHGIEIGDLRARQVRPSDFHAFDLLLAMDADNLKGLHRLAPGPELAAKARLIMDLVPGHPLREVPDPWYGGPEGFEEVFAMLDEATDRLMDELHHGS